MIERSAGDGNSVPERCGDASRGARTVDRAGDIFLQVVDLPPRDRDQALIEACRHDGALRDEVRAMIEMHEGSVPELRATALTLLTAVPERLGRYQVGERIAYGGMAVVYRAVQDETRREVALKLITTPFKTDMMRRLFAREVEVLARLNHPGIAQIYEASLAPGDEGDIPYFAMELIEGETLDRHVQSHRLPVRERLELLITICDAVQHAHQKGVLHRDLKPRNIMVTAGGRPKVLDFGIARSVEVEAREPGDVTGGGPRLGTPRYMSPEQFTASPEDLDSRSDLYALGVVAFELLAGRLPYDLDPDDIEAARAVITTVAPRPLVIEGPGVTRHLQRELPVVLEKALAKDRDDRYLSVAALAADLRRCVELRPTEVRPGGGWHQSWLLARRNPVAALLAGVAVLALVAGTVLASWQARIATIQRNGARAATRRAEDAAAAARSATAESLYNLGRMASHRGDWKRARESYRQARLLGYPNEIRLRIGEIEAGYGLFEEDAPRRGLAELAGRDDLGPYRASVTLMRGLFGVGDPAYPWVSPLEFVRRALEQGGAANGDGDLDRRGGLTPGAVWLARAFLAEDLATMRRCLERSLMQSVGLEDAPFRDALYRLALVDLVPILIVLGDLDEARVKVGILRSSLPDDPTADLLAGGIAVFAADPDGVAHSAKCLRDKGFLQAAAFLEGTDDLLRPRLAGFQESWMNELLGSDPPDTGSLASDIKGDIKDVIRLIGTNGPAEGGGARLGVVFSAVPVAFSNMISIPFVEMGRSLGLLSGGTRDSTEAARLRDLADRIATVAPIGAAFFVRGYASLAMEDYAGSVRDFTLAAHTPSPLPVDRVARFLLAHTLALRYAQTIRSRPGVARSLATSASRVIEHCLTAEGPDARELKLLCAQALRIEDAGLAERIAGRWWRASHEAQAREIQLAAAETVGSPGRLEDLARELEKAFPGSPAARRYLERGK